MGNTCSTTSIQPSVVLAKLAACEAVRRAHTHKSQELPIQPSPKKAAAAHQDHPHHWPSFRALHLRTSPSTRTGETRVDACHAKEHTQHNTSTPTSNAPHRQPQPPPLTSRHHTHAAHHPISLYLSTSLSPAPPTPSPQPPSIHRPLSFFGCDSDAHSSLFFCFC